MTMPVYIPGIHIDDNGNLVIDADEMDAAGVKSVEFIKQPPTDAEAIAHARATIRADAEAFTAEAGSGAAELICECGHSADTHDPCCVSACGCDGFEPRKPSIEELFKAVMREIKDLAQDALGYDQICDPIQAVRRLAQEFAGMKRRAEMADARNALLFKEKADAIMRIAELEAQIRVAGDGLKRLQVERGELERQLAEANDAREIAECAAYQYSTKVAEFELAAKAAAESTAPTQEGEGE